MDLPWSCSIGPGFCIVHGWGLVVTPGARIGSNVTLFHGATIGRRDPVGFNERGPSEFPTIEDDVWVGPHAIIVGAVTIGSGSRIAGGSFVAKDVAPACIVGGNPGAVLKSGAAPDVFNRAPLPLPAASNELDSTL